MFQKALNHALLTIRLQPDGPVLIKSGREAGADPTIVDMNFVRTHHIGLGQDTTVYLPGSSLKGTLRSYCERGVRTVGLFCCDPFADGFCGKKLQNEEDGAKRHNNSCAVCRIFGNTVLGGRFLVGDAYPTKETVQVANQTEQRDGVAIDRLSGGTVPGALFTLEVVTRGKFEAQLVLENFELWQLGLLAIALRDLGSGLCPIGYGKSRGLGRMSVIFTRLEVGYPGWFAPQEDGKDFDSNLYGVSAFDVPQGYHVQPEQPLALELSVDQDLASSKGEVSTSKNKGEQSRLGTLIENGDFGRVAIAFEGHEAVQTVLKKAASFWKNYVQQHRKRKNDD